MKFTYLLINFFSILVPFLRSFEPKLRFYRKLRYYIPAILLTALFFIIWDYFKTKAGVWSFNDRYILGIKIGGLPLEECLFFFTIPYACVFVYEALSYYIPRLVFTPRLRNILYALSVLSFFSSLFIFPKTYTFSVLFIIGLVLPIAIRILNKEQLDKLLLSYLICFIPMFIVNGLLTALPVVLYDDTRNLGIRLGTIPVEDFIYFAIFHTMNISIYAFLSKKER